ncbi:hypothetical protein [Polyangium spumosum]|uniref:Uncharacterized protein n=1 Tax=Polyangium spumosum TaxID=889282 RepID=A0A6N7Q282_9BACT|nr:hypothetical protein [Polyangium spumosum]MRG97817.1 hypothetical protein [Polyangium spumosum]
MKGPYRAPGTRDRGGEGFFRSLRRRFFATDEERREDEEWRLAEHEERLRRVGPSPVPWIGDRLWAEWNVDNPRGERDAGHNPICMLQFVPVTEDDLRRAPIARPLSGSALPPKGTLDDHRHLIDSTPGRGRIDGPKWPVCCDRLGTLLRAEGYGSTVREIEAIGGTLERCLLDIEIHPPRPTAEERLAIRAHAKLQGRSFEKFVEWGLSRPPTPPETIIEGWKESLEQDGDLDTYLAIFQCRECGRIYGSYSEPD